MEGYFLHFSPLKNLHILTFQAFVSKFKICEQNASRHRSALLMEPLMYETYNPQNQTKYVNAGLFLPPIQKIYLKGKDNHSYIVYEWFNI